MTENSLIWYNSQPCPILFWFRQRKFTTYEILFSKGSKNCTWFRKTSCFWNAFKRYSVLVICLSDPKQRRSYKSSNVVNLATNLILTCCGFRLQLNAQFGFQKSEQNDNNSIFEFRWVISSPEKIRQLYNFFWLLLYRVWKTLMPFSQS